MSEMAETDMEQGRPNYFEEVNEFGMFLDNMAKMVHKIKEANQDFAAATGSAAIKEIKGRMMEDIDEVEKMAPIMKEKLRKMIRNNVDNRKKRGCEKGTAIDISRMSLIIELKTRIKERKSDFQNLGETIRQEYLNVIQRRVFTVTGIESLFVDENEDDPRFVIKMMNWLAAKNLDVVIRVILTSSVAQLLQTGPQGISAEQMVAAVDEIKERYVAAADFDKKMLKVRKNFEQMAVLVEAKAVNEALKLARSADEEPCGERKKTERCGWGWGWSSTSART